MKPAPFTYLRPRTVSEAVSMLEAHGEDAKVIAGGQSLVPLMNLRLSQPPALVDIFHLDELRSIVVDQRAVTIGAAVTEAMILEHPQGIPAVVRAAVSSIGHIQIRSRGTVGGSLCHNDPSAEWPALAHALDATLTIRGSGGERHLRAADFQAGPLMTTIQPDEVLTTVSIIERPRRWGFAEVARRSGDFALVGAMACELGSGWRVVVFGAGSSPQRLRGVESLLTAGRDLSGAADIARAEIRAGDDLHGSAAYRTHVACGVIQKVVAQACS